jgi:predicted ATPase/signal transduction histidine kinase
MYSVSEVIYASDHSVIYRGTGADGRHVVIKVLTPQYGPQHLERLRNECEIGRTLNIPTAAKPIALETYEGRPALVMEDCGGEPLSRQLRAPIEIRRFLRLAVAIAAAVADIHRSNVVHKDLKPDSILILVHAATDEVRVLDFGIAAPLPCQRPSSASVRLIEGSLPYMSPEQTGRTNRAPDQRSDLYSLGVIFYEMLTGRLPFRAADPLEWVHCHIARSAIPPAELLPSVPAVISDMVMRLLAKEPVDRFQSARGLRHDLERCLEQWKSRGSIEPFPLRERDVSDLFQIPQKLYGRDEERRALLAAFERVVDTGTPEFALVSGYSGIGKSSLVHELQKPIVRARGFFASGKFDQYRRDIPYSTILLAFTELIFEILTESEEQVAAWREQLKAALGVNAQLIVDVIPPVELVIGRQPPVSALPPQEARNRFRIMFRHFIEVFAQKDHPLALFLDDLQWADSASLALLEDLVTHPEARHLFVVGAYRDNEVSPSHPLLLTLDEVRRAGAHVSNVVLGPLSNEHLNVFISDALHCRIDDAALLAELVKEKTAGNPLFAIQFLTALHEERLIEFDGEKETWRWNIAKIRSKGFTDNVGDLMVGKLKRLPPAAQEAVTRLACLGNSADIATVAMALGQSEEKAHADASDAAWAGLLVRLGDKYKFIHDRVEEAAYSLIPEEQRAAMHLQIGRRFVSQMPAEAIEERVFDVVNQLNRGVELITDDREKRSLCRLNFLAGKKAKAAIAYASARSWLAQATALLGPDPWNARYEETFALNLERAECEYLLGNFQTADELFDLVLDNARSNLDRAKGYSLRIRQYQVAGRYDEAVTIALEALRLFGVTFPQSAPEIQAAMEAESREITGRMHGRRIADLVDAPVATDRNMRAIIALLVEALPCAYVLRSSLMPLLCLKAVSFSLRYGNTEEACFTYCFYGVLLVSILGDIPSGIQFSEMSLRLNEKFNNVKLTGTLLHLHGTFVQFWRGHLATCRPIMERGFVASLNAGDLVYAGFNTVVSTLQVVEKGDPLDEVLRMSQKYLAFAKQSHNDAVYHCLRQYEQFVAAMKGLTQEPTSFNDNTFDEAECLVFQTKAEFGSGVFYHHLLKQMAAVIFGRFSEALESAHRAEPFRNAVVGTMFETTHHFYHALSLTALYADVAPAGQGAYAGTVQDTLRKLKLWAETSPVNQLNRYALVSAEVARIEGRDLDAMRFYEEAIRSAGENGFVQNEGLANEMAARFYRARGFGRIADTYLRAARVCYARWGADGKIRQLDQLHPELREQPLVPAVTLAVGAERLDVLSVVKASQAISGEIVLNRLLSKLVQVVIEQAGAQKGYVILRREGQLTIEAEALLDETGAMVVKLLHSLPMASSPLLPASIVSYLWRTKQHVLLENAAETPKFSSDDYIARVRPKSVLGLPILKQAELVGLLYLENNLVTGAFTVGQLEVLKLLASQAAISLENALLLSKEQAARVAAQVEERHAAFLAEASAILSESLDYQQVLRQLARLSIRDLADFCIIDLIEDGEIKRLTAMHADPGKQPLLDELQRRYPPGNTSPQPAARAIRSGLPHLMVTDADIRAACLDDEHVRLMQAIGTRSGLSVPLVVRGKILGSLTLGSATPGHFGQAHLNLVQELAHRAAIAIDNAHLHRQTLEALRMRQEFLTVASHELRTPLTSLTLSLNALQQADQSLEPLSLQQMNALVQMASRQGKRLERLISELLDVSRIDMGQLRLELAQVNLEALVRYVVNRFALDLAQASCSVSMHEEASVVGRWDRSRLDQVVANLLSNAIKFGAGKPIDIIVGQEAGIARLVVKDFGIGIAAAQQARIFERFERAVSSEHYGGLGLGLYICRRIVEAHGGSICVASQLGEGATFRVELPCVGPPAAKGAAPANPGLSL